MKKIALFTLLYFPAVTLFAQHYKNNVDTVVTNYSDCTYYKVINKQGLLIEEYYLNNNLLDGTWSTYYSNGFPHTITVYRNGKKTGNLITLGKDGYLETSISYLEDKLNGLYRVYYKGTRINKEINYKIQIIKNILNFDWPNMNFLKPNLALITKFLCLKKIKIW
jgi:antitoxin component YwqK of YwqJK toxin-antitoxin module